MAQPLQQTQPTRTKPRRFYANYCSHGIYEPPFSPKQKNRRDFDLVRTVVQNGNQLILTQMPFDFDYEKSDPRWQINGKLSFELIYERILKIMPGFLDVSVTSVRSASGRGFALLLNIGSLPITYETENVRAVFRTLQNQLIKIFQMEGFGCDSSANGLNRFVPNFLNTNNLLLDQRELHNTNRREKLNHIQLFVNCIKMHEKRMRIYRDERIERKFANLYRELFDAHMDFVPHVTYTRGELQELTGIDKRTLRKIISKDFVGLVGFNVTRTREGFQFRLSGDYDDWVLRLTHLDELNRDQLTKRTPKKRLSRELNAPETVMDGERNHFLWTCAAYLTSCFDSLHDVENHLFEIASRIPNHGVSRNCRPAQLTKIARWAYQQKQKFCQVKYNIPEWMKKIPIYRRSVKQFKEVLEGTLFRAKVGKHWLVYEECLKTGNLKIHAVVCNGRSLTHGKTSTHWALKARFGQKYRKGLPKKQLDILAIWSKFANYFENLSLKFVVFQTPYIYDLRKGLLFQEDLIQNE